jgi:hypothetical protein
MGTVRELEVDGILKAVIIGGVVSPEGGGGGGGAGASAAAIAWI